MNEITPRMDRRNGLIFGIYNLLNYFAAPIVYVGVVQAALCDRLGASATIANLPASAYFFGFFAPIILSSSIPHRSERAAVVVANLVTASSLAAVGLALLLPVSDSIRLTAVIGQGLVLGFSDSVSIVYSYQCLGRGTTLEGRARALKFAFTIGPLSAVIGSVGAQFVLNGSIHALAYPYDFALLYLMGVPCMLGIAFVSSRYELVPLRETDRQPFFRYMVESVRSFRGERTLVLLWLAYLFAFVTLNAVPNLSLYTKEALGREPKDFSGLIMALRFGFKVLGGFALGVIVVRWGVRAPLTVTVLLLGGATVWAWIAPGYFYLLAFGLMGAGELIGAYFPNYLIAFSTAGNGARNQALLALVTPVSGLAPVLYGRLTDLFGFQASFTFGIAMAALSLWLVLKLPRRVAEGI
jgi:MFS family permease